MSRDQRPGRVKMVGASAPTAEPQRRSTDEGPIDGAAAPADEVASVAPKSRAIIWSLLFLVACGAGAAGVAVLSASGS